MPALVHAQSALTQRGLLLTSEDAQEQINGLLNVAIEYVALPVYRDTVAQEFYVDAPPPIWPSTVDRESLQGRSLFMSNRSIRQENGLLFIRAEYAGAMLRSENSYLLTVDREVKNTRIFWAGIFRSTTTAELVALSYQAAYRWISVIHNYEYASVNNYVAELPTPVLDDLCALESVSGSSPFVETIINNNEQFSVTYNGPFTTEEARRFINLHEIIETLTPTYITPSVRVLRRQVFSQPPSRANFDGLWWRDALVAT
jgi:hypothetical protein